MGTSERLQRIRDDRWASQLEAELADIQFPPGTVVSGPIVDEQPFGLFFQISGTRVRGLILITHQTTQPKLWASIALGSVVQGTILQPTRGNSFYVELNRVLTP